MKFSVVAYHLPEREGTASGRILRAWCEGIRAEGHDLELWSWCYTPPEEELPAWCRWERLPAEALWRTRARAFFHPRNDIVRARWEPPADAICIGDDVTSFPAVRPSPRSVMTLHYLTPLDAGAVRRRAARDVQAHRAERRVARDAALLFAYSDRVATHAAAPATFVPMAYEVPDEALPPVEAPVALMAADWSWPPNHVALARLLRLWPDLQQQVRRATLLLAGRHLERASVGHLDGVRLLGAYERAQDVLSQAAVLVFPCPPSSGPKVKVAEALSYGVPVVTTTAGTEGLVVDEGDGVVIGDSDAALRDALVCTLADPASRAALGARGRAAMLTHHAPRVVARRRVEACRRAFGE